MIGVFHRASGVELLAGGQIAAFEGTGRLEAARTAGARVPCDFAVAGIGIDPDVPILAGMPIAQANGVLVNELCRASAADVYAAGDVANHRHPLFGRVRVEHYNNAEKQGAAAARSMFGSAASYDYVHTFWSDQYEHKLEYVGHAASWDEFPGDRKPPQPDLRHSSLWPHQYQSRAGRAAPEHHMLYVANS